LWLAAAGQGGVLRLEDITIIATAKDTTARIKMKRAAHPKMSGFSFQL
jgi:hypothetical protein